MKSAFGIGLHHTAFVSAWASGAVDGSRLDRYLTPRIDEVLMRRSSQGERPAAGKRMGHVEAEHGEGPMLEGKQEFVEALKSGVRRHVASIRATNGHGTLLAYALATDDELSTLLAYAITTSNLGPGAEADLLFSPTDWPLVNEVDFDAASSTLAARASSAPDSGAHVDESFELLTRALEELKDEHEFDGIVFLSVLSTDPCDHLEQLEDASVRRLNFDALVGARAAFLARWTRASR